MKNFGETLKRIRKQKEMTQEQLAEYLGISPQSVSKWETNLTLPDITMIPMLANIFDISTDVLLGVDIYSKEKRIQEILNQAEEYHRNGYNAEKARHILRKGLEEFPNSYKIMSNLMNFIYYQIYDDNKTGEDENKLTTEIISLGEKIIAECTDDNVRHGTIQTLCYTYPLAGKSEDAVKLAEKMPQRCLSRESLLVMVYRGTKQFEQRRNNLFGNVGEMISDLIFLNTTLDDGSNPFSTEECIVINQKIINLLNLIFDDGNYGFYRYAAANAYHNIAKFYAHLDNHKNAIKNLKLATEQTIQCDEEYDPAPDKEYSTLFFKGMKITADYIKEKNRFSLHQLEKMENCFEFDVIRNTKEFIEIEEKLKRYVKK